MIWLNEAHFGFGGPYNIEDFKRTMHHRIMKQSVDAVFMIIGLMHVM